MCVVYFFHSLFFFKPLRNCCFLSPRYWWELTECERAENVVDFSDRCYFRSSWSCYSRLNGLGWAHSQTCILSASIIYETKQAQTFLYYSYLEIDYDNDDIECNLPLLNGAVLSATSALNERGPENARLNGELNFFSYCILNSYPFEISCVLMSYFIVNVFCFVKWSVFFYEFCQFIPYNFFCSVGSCRECVFLRVVCLYYIEFLSLFLTVIEGEKKMLVQWISISNFMQRQRRSE